MNKWILISASLLPMFFIGCTEHSLGGDSLPKEDVLVNFSAGKYVDYDIEVVPCETNEMETGATRAATTYISTGIVAVPITEYDVDDDVDCLYGLTEESFCLNLKNAEYAGTHPGVMKPVDGLLRTFPIEEGSAIAAYAYYPYQKDALVVGDTTCYVKLDLIKEHMRKDYCYTGKIFKKKKDAIEGDGDIKLNYHHAFAEVKVDFNVNSNEFIRIDSLLMGVSNNGVGLLDLKNGNFYPEKNNGKNVSFDITEIRNTINGREFSASTVLYIPPSVKLKNVKIVYRKRSGGRTFTRVYPFEREPQYQMGKTGYTIDITLNVPSTDTPEFGFTDEEADENFSVLTSKKRGGWENLMNAE